MSFSNRFQTITLNDNRISWLPSQTVYCNQQGFQLNQVDCLNVYPSFYSQLCWFFLNAEYQRGCFKENSVFEKMGRFTNKIRSKFILSYPVFNSFYFLASRQAKYKLQNNQTDNLTLMWNRTWQERITPNYNINKA